MHAGTERGSVFIEKDRFVMRCMMKFNKQMQSCKYAISRSQQILDHGNSIYKIETRGSISAIVRKKKPSKDRQGSELSASCVLNIEPTIETKKAHRT